MPKPSSVEELLEIADGMMVHNIILGSEVEVLKSVIWLLMQRSGDDKVNGIRFDRWFASEKTKRMKDALLSLEKNNPEMAAHLQQILDKAEDKSDSDSPNQK